MASLPLNMMWEKAQTLWASILNPIVSNPINSAQILSQVQLINGTTIVQHKLGRTLQGWWIMSPQGSCNVYQPSTAPNNSMTLTLVSNAAVVVNIAVF